MFNFVKRFFTYFKEECLGLKRVAVEHYPFDKSMRDYLPNAYSPFFAIRFARDIADAFNISFTEAEILLFLISEPDAVYIHEISDVIDHVSQEHIKRLLREMFDAGYLYRLEETSGLWKYGLMLELRNDIGSYYKD